MCRFDFLILLPPQPELSMSTRQIRRLAQQRTVPDLEQSDSEPEIEAAAQVNAFQALVIDGDDDTSSDESEDEQPIETAKPEPTPPDTKSKSSRRRRRRKKKKEKQPDDDELFFPAPPPPQETKRVHPLTHVLPFTAREFKAEVETQKIFGKLVTEKKERGYRRRTLLVTLEPDWPRIEPNLLHMELTSTPMTYKFVLGRAYEEKQREYHAVIGSMDPQALIAFLQEFPYHIDGLSALYGLLSRTGNIRGAADAATMAVAAFESAFDSSFANGLLDGTVLLETDTLGVKFLTALIRYGHMCSKRGLHATALAYCSLALRLTHKDVVGAMQCIDYFALRAQKYSVILDLWRNMEEVQSYPNMCYSYALALRNGDHCACRWHGKGTSQSLCATAAMVQAILMYPSILHVILLRCGVSSDHSIWHADLFQADPWSCQMGTKSTMPTVAARMSRMYIERSHTLFRDPSVLTWALDAAEEAVKTPRDCASTAIDNRNRMFDSISDDCLAKIDMADFAENVDTIPDLDADRPQNVPVPLDMPAWQLFFASLVPWFQLPPETRDPERDM